MNFMVNKNNAKGITLIALVITIIVLLILAGITIATLTGENGLFSRAKEAKLEAKRSQIIEWLNLKLIEEQSADIDRTSEEIIIATRENVIKNQNELKQMGKDVAIGEVLNETINEDPRKENTYFEVIVDGDIYKVEMSGAKLIGSLNEIGPKINLKSITNTTNTITVNVKTEKNEGGKIEYYIKGEDEEKYTLKETTTNETYTYLNLEQNKKYNIKIVAVAKNGRTAELLVDRTTGKVADLTIGNTIFEYSTKEWTNGNVTVTAKTTVTGYILQTSKDGRNWTSTTTQTFTENGTVYARLWDGTNYGGTASGSVTNIDKIKPIATGVTTNITSTINSVTLTGKSQDNESGIIAYGWTENSSQPVGTTTTGELGKWTEIAQTTSQISQNVTVNSNGTKYFWTKDKAGNVNSSNYTVNNIVSRVEISNYSNITLLRGNSGTPELNYTGTPKEQSFSVSNPNMASIDTNGRITAKTTTGNLTATVTFKNYDDTIVTKSCTVTINKGVAAIGTTDFSSVQNAVNAITSSGIIDIIDNTTEYVIIQEEKNIKLQGGDNTFTGTIDNFGNLEIASGKYTRKNGVAINNLKKTLLISGGEISNTDGYTIDNYEGCTTKITGGSVKNTATVASGSLTNIHNRQNAILEITNGTIETIGTVHVTSNIFNYGIVNIHGGNIISNRPETVIFNTQNGTINITEGRLTAKSGRVIRK